MGKAGEGSVPIPVEADEVVQMKAEHASGGCGCSEGMNSCWTAQQNMHASSGCTMVQKRCFGPQTSSRLLREEKFQVTTRSIHKLNGDAIEEQILDDELENGVVEEDDGEHDPEDMQGQTQERSARILIQR